MRKLEKIPFFWWLVALFSKGQRLENTTGKTKFVALLCAGHKVSLHRKMHPHNVFMWAKHTYTVAHGHTIEVVFFNENEPTMAHYLMCPLQEFAREIMISYQKQAHMSVIWLLREFPKGMKGARVMYLSREDPLLKRVIW